MKDKIIKDLMFRLIGHLEDTELSELERIAYALGVAESIITMLEQPEIKIIGGGIENGNFKNI